MGPKNESGFMLFLFILCASLLIIPLPAMGSHDEKPNSTGNYVEPEFPDAPIVVTDSSLGSALGKYPLLVLDCWEKGCRPCQRIDRKIDEMAADLKGRVVFGKLNIKQNSRTTTKYKVFNYPTVLIFKNGALVYRHIGDAPKDRLENLILSKLGVN